MSQGFEYDTVERGDPVSPELQDVLDRKATEGWELVSFDGSAYHFRRALAWPGEPGARSRTGQPSGLLSSVPEKGGYATRTSRR
jgi:hypothetical protein